MNSMIYRTIFFAVVVLINMDKLGAQCTSNAGNMVYIPVDACGTETVTASHAGNQNLDANDAMQYVLHTSAGPVLGVVLAESTTPSFALPFIGFYGQTYYISAIVGNDLGGGNVDTSDPCLSVSSGTPVTWHELPTAIVPNADIIICDGGNIQIAINLTGGGLWSLIYSIDGVVQPPVNTSNSPALLNLSPTGSSEICLLEISDQYCTSLIANGCFDVIVNPELICSIFTSGITCAGQDDGSASLTCMGGTPPYSFSWSNGATTPALQNLALGTYSVTVVDANGCTGETNFIITDQGIADCTINVSNSINCINPEAEIGLDCLPDMIFDSIFWSGPNGFSSNEPFTTINEPGTYSVIMHSAFGVGCDFADTIVVTGGNLDCGSILGRLTTELDGNCTLDPGENGLSGWMVRATATNGDEYFGITDSLGQYDFIAALSDYTVEAIPPANFWDDCTGPILLTLSDTADVDTADFHQFQVINCPLMEVDISTPLLRRCFNNNYYVSYCNNGSETATDAIVVVTLDPLIEFVGSASPHTVSGTEITFPVGDLAPGDCGSFYFTALVSCNAVLGQTLCAEAHIYPDSICGPSDPNWSGAFVEATSTCTADSVIFTLTNTGTGDMDEPSYFIVVQDGVMLMTQEFELEAGASTTVSYPANGATYSLLAEQVADAPGNSQPSLFVEGWGGNGSFSTGFALQFPENDEDPFLSIDCQEVIGSYDPNDKRGYPLGFGPNFLIEEGQLLDYHIRFQNTGTDTAFKVVIKDIIHPNLDIATLRPGTSSHPYQLDIHQDTLLFIFENILLPDSFVNEPASHGFVKFSIGQRAGLAIGSVIENEAGIYFDFNDPVITNRTRHQVGEPFIVNAVEPPVLRSKIQCTVYPNPMGEEAVVLIENAENQQFELRLYDMVSRYLRSEKITGGMGKIRKNGLARGLYFYEIRADGFVVGQGKVAME